MRKDRESLLCRTFYIYAPLSSERYESGYLALYVIFDLFCVTYILYFFPSFARKYYDCKII